MSATLHCKRIKSRSQKKSIANHKSQENQLYIRYIIYYIVRECVYKLAHSYFRVSFSALISLSHRLKKFMSKGECHGYMKETENEERILGRSKEARLCLRYFLNLL